MSVSVIIPTLDRPRRLKRALNSVVDQTTPPSEIIVVDGGDPERTAEVLDSIEADVEHIRQETGGRSKARNSGIRRSSGEYVTFLDDDDWWKRHKLSRQLDAMSESSAAFSYTGVKSVTTSGDTINVTRPADPITMDELLAKNTIGTPSTVMVERSQLTTISGFDEAFETREDWDLYIRLLERCSPVPVPDPLVIKESHEGSLSNDIEQIESSWSRIMAKHGDKYSKETRNEFWANHYFILGQQAAKSNDFAVARRYYLRSLRRNAKFNRFGHLFATFLGAAGYDRMTILYRFIRSRLP